MTRRLIHQPLPQSPIHLRRRDDVGWLPQRQERCRGCGHAGPEQEGRGPALQVRQNALDLANGGIVCPAIAVAPPILVVGIAHERARHVDRRNEAAGGSIGNAARLGGDCLGVEVLDGDAVVAGGRIVPS